MREEALFSVNGIQLRHQGSYDTQKNSYIRSNILKRHILLLSGLRSQIVFGGPKLNSTSQPLRCLKQGLVALIIEEAWLIATSISTRKIN